MWKEYLRSLKSKLLTYINKFDSFKDHVHLKLFDIVGKEYFPVRISLCSIGLVLLFFGGAFLGQYNLLSILFIVLGTILYVLFI